MILSVVHIHVCSFARKYVNARITSPIAFTHANMIVAILPQSKMSSLTKRPTVPMISKIKAINLTTSLTIYSLFAF